MIDMVDIYELRNHLRHLNLEENDFLIIKKLIESHDFKNIEKLDILYIILYTIKFPENEFTDNEIREKISIIVDQLSDISIYNYTQEELNKIKIFYFYYLKKVANINDLDELINELENTITNNINTLISQEAMLYINEELRMVLLNYYHFYNDIYLKNESKIIEHLKIAKEQKDFRLKIATILNQ